MDRIILSSVIVGFIAFLGAPIARADLQALNINQNISDQNLSDDESQASRFDQLLAAYDSATTPAAAELTGWFSGRCFRYNSVNTPENTLLVGFVQEEGNKDGPMFPPVRNFKLAQLVNQSRDADYFDSIGEELKSQISKYVDDNKNTFSVASPNGDGALASEFNEGNLRYQIKKQGDYLIAKDTVIRSNEYYTEGMVFNMCYYFKKVD